MMWNDDKAKGDKCAAYGVFLKNGRNFLRILKHFRKHTQNNFMFSNKKSTH